jgi:putative oxidoreductase
MRKDLLGRSTAPVARTTVPMPLAVTTVRMLLGLILLVAGALKVGHADDLAAAIAGFRLLPASVVGPIAFVLPFVEILLGGYLIAGLFTRIAGWITAAAFAIYAAVIASAIVRHIPAACGCFGPGDRATADWPHVAIDAILALAGVFVALCGPGALAIDRRFQRTT